MSNIRRTEGGVLRMGTRRRSMRGIRKLARVWRTSELVPPREEDQGNVVFEGVALAARDVDCGMFSGQSLFHC
jgi:hypothetical protein